MITTMRTLGILVLLCTGTFLHAQNDALLKSHYEAYYKQMMLQGDAQGIISAMTHLNVLDPSTARRDTLAYFYANNEMHMQALNLLGIDISESDSDIAVQVKSLSLKALNQPQRALPHFQELFKRYPSAYLAYEIADLKIQLGENAGALLDIEYGVENATPEMTYAFYERQQPYELPLKAALIHLKGLAQYGMNRNNIDKAMATFDEALAIAPNFNLASLSKQALAGRKENPEAQD
jgi:tetratricopeptide (TPR) repeat protein